MGLPLFSIYSNKNENNSDTMITLKECATAEITSFNKQTQVTSIPVCFSFSSTKIGIQALKSTRKFKLNLVLKFQ